MPTRGPQRSTSLTDNGTTVSTTENLLVGGQTTVGNAQTTGPILAGAPALVVVHGSTNGLTGGLNIDRASADANASNLQFYKTRATDPNTQTTVANSDVLSSINTFATDGTTIQQLSRIRSVVNGAVSAGVVPTDIVFQTSATSSAGLAEAMRITSGQSVTFANGFTTTAGIVNLGSFSRVTGSNFTTTNLTATNITGLTAALAINSTYAFRAFLSVNGADANGLKVAVQYSAAGASVEATANGSLLATSGQCVRINALNTLTAAFATSATDGGITIEGIMPTGANAGNLTIQVAKVTSGTATVYINSYLDVKRIA